MRKIVALALLALLLGGEFFAQEAEAPKFGFAAGINLGTDILPTGPAGANEGWTRLGFQPDISFGKFGVGIDLTARIQLYKTQDQAVTFYAYDWIPDPSKEQNLLDVYLPKFLYIRYGVKGEDPFFAKLGSIDDLSLGAGFIMGNYSNMMFMPENRIFGLDIGLDGALFNFPWVGAELVAGNLARFDVVGGRLYARPLQGTGLPILKNMQLGFSAVADTQPNLYDPTGISGAPDSPVMVYGGDIMAPILGTPVLSLAAFTELAMEPNDRLGFMMGFGGKLIGIFTYGAQLRVLGAGFIPSYFDSNYDLYRSAKAAFVSAPATGEGTTGWYASLGTSLLEDKIILKASLDGPFSATPATASDDQAKYPHLRAVFGLGEDLLGGIYADATYEKYFLGRETGFFQDMIDPTDAVMGLNVHYKTGGSVLTLRYNARFDPLTGEFKTTSSIEAGLKL